MSRRHRSKVSGRLSNSVTTTEARQIGDRSHPLFAVETAVSSLTGLPDRFTSEISAFATKFEVEYTVSGAVDDGVTDVETIRERVRSGVRTLSDEQHDATDEAIHRLTTKQILDRDGQTVRHRSPSIST